MEYAEVIHILQIALLEVESGTMFFRQKVQRVESLSLRFCDRRDILRPGLSEKSSEVASCVLDQNSLRSRLCGWLVVKQGT